MIKTITYDYEFSNWVQESSIRIKTSDYYDYPGFSSITVTITGATKPLQFNFVGLNSSGNEVVDLYWYDSGTTINIPTNTSMVRWYLWARYSDNSSGISPSDVISCTATATVTIDTPWLIENGDYPYLETLPKILPNLEESYPVSIMTQVDGNYPKYPNLNLVSMSSPYPISLFVQKPGGYPYIQGLHLIPLQSPYPVSVLIQEPGKYPKYEQLNPINMGAFLHTNSLIKLKIPNTVSSIGRYSFTESSLTSVHLPDTCTYYITSFPSNCEVTGGQLILEP